MEIVNRTCDTSDRRLKLDTDTLVSSFEFIEDSASVTKQYVNSKYGYIISYPKNISLIGNNNADIVIVNDHIKITGGIGSSKLPTCIDKWSSTIATGECPKVETNSDVEINGFKIKKIGGIRSMGAAPYRFMTYVFSHKDYFFEFEVTEVPVNQLKNTYRKVGPIPNDKVLLIENILNSLRFI